MLFRTITLLAIGNMLLFFVLNMTVFNLPAEAWFDLSVAGILAAIHFHLGYAPDSRLSKIVIGILITLCVVFWLHLTENTHHSFFWIVIVPPMLLFLLGKQWGAMLSLSLLAYFIALTYFLFDGWNSKAFDLISLFNVVAAFTCLTFFIIFYENSRMAAYKLLFEKSRELEELSCTDSLTRLHNRYYLQKTLDAQVEKSKQNGIMFSVILIDVNLFKHINDTYGHLVGDSALQEIAFVLRNALTEHFTVGRWGGDEFLIICPNTPLSVATSTATTLREKVEKFHYTHGLHCSISTGVSTYKHGQNSLEETLSQADQALYAYKQQNRQQRKAA